MIIVDKYQLTVEENVFLAKRNIVDSIYKESRLEGIAITFPETNEIYEGRAVAGMSVDDIVKVNNLKHAWQFILDTVEYPIDLRYIRQLVQKFLNKWTIFLFCSILFSSNQKEH